MFGKKRTTNGGTTDAGATPWENRTSRITVVGKEEEKKNTREKKDRLQAGAGRKAVQKGPLLVGNKQYA